MNIYTKWVFSLVTVWFVLLSPGASGDRTDADRRGTNPKQKREFERTSC